MAFTRYFGVYSDFRPVETLAVLSSQDLQCRLSEPLAFRCKFDGRLLASAASTMEARDAEHFATSFLD